MNSITRQYVLRNRIVELALKARIPPSAVDLDDMAYALPSQEWLTGEYAKWLKQALQAWGLNYSDEAWDCDNFSRFTAAMAQVAHARTGQPDDALAFGEFRYLTRDFTGHMICAAVVREAPDEIRFFEPQPNFSCLQELKLSGEEIKSCTRLRF